MNAPQPLTLDRQSCFPPQHTEATRRSNKATEFSIPVHHPSPTKLSIFIKPSSSSILKENIEYFLCDATKTIRLCDREQELMQKTARNKKQSKPNSDSFEYTFTFSGEPQEQPVYIRFQLRDRPHLGCFSRPLYVVCHSKHYAETLEKIMWHTLTTNSPSGQVTVKAAVDCIAEVLQLWAKVPDNVKAVRENTADFYNIVGPLIVKHELGEAIDASEFVFLLKKMLPFKSLESETQLQKLWTHKQRLMEGYLSKVEAKAILEGVDTPTRTIVLRFSSVDSGALMTVSYAKQKASRLKFFHTRILSDKDTSTYRQEPNKNNSKQPERMCSYSSLADLILDLNDSFENVCVREWNSEHAQLQEKCNSLEAFTQSETEIATPVGASDNRSNAKKQAASPDYKRVKGTAWEKKYRDLEQQFKDLSLKYEQVCNEFQELRQFLSLPQALLTSETEQGHTQQISPEDALQFAANVFN